MLKKLKNFLVDKAFKYFYASESGMCEVRHAPAYRAFLRHNRCDVSQANVKKYVEEHLKTFIVSMNEWNKRLGSPILLKEDLNNYTLNDWLDIEKELCKIHMAQSTQIFTEEGIRLLYNESRHNVKLPKTNFDISHILFIGYGVLLAMGIITTTLGEFSTVELISTGKLILLQLGISGFITYKATVLLDGNPMRDRITQGLSKTWDEVFTENTSENSLLISSMSEFLRQKPYYSNFNIDFTKVTPAEAFNMFTTYAGAPTWIRTWNLVIDKVPKNLVSFSPAISDYSQKQARIEVPNSTIESLLNCIEKVRQADANSSMKG